MWEGLSTLMAANPEKFNAGGPTASVPFATIFFI